MAVRDGKSELEELMNNKVVNNIEEAFNTAINRSLKPLLIKAFYETTNMLIHQIFYPGTNPSRYYGNVHNMNSGQNRDYTTRLAGTGTQRLEVRPAAEVNPIVSKTYRRQEFTDIDEAMETLAILKDICMENGCATVMDLYEAAGKEVGSFETQLSSWGWDKGLLDDAHVITKGVGNYMLKMPKAIKLS